MPTNIFADQSADVRGCNLCLLVCPVTECISMLTSPIALDMAPVPEELAQGKVDRLSGTRATRAGENANMIIYVRQAHVASFKYGDVAVFTSDGVQMRPQYCVSWKPRQRRAAGPGRGPPLKVV